MGLTFKDIGNKFDSIIEFAGLQEFVDTPIKFYSSGMVSRLAFAIAMHVEAEILLIDEYFGGVGDIEFQNKSSEIFHKHILSGKTIIFVSHDMSIIKEHCHRVCVLSKGRNIYCGHPEEAIDSYEKLMAEHAN